MPNHPQHKPDAAPDKLRQWPSWARRYALSRTLGLLVSLAVCGVGFGIFARLGLLWGSADRAGNVTAVMACCALIAGFTIFRVWPSLVGMNRLVGAVTTRLYRREGEVTVLPEGKPGLPVGVKTACPMPCAVRDGRPVLRRGSSLIGLLALIAVIVALVAIGLDMSPSL